MVKRVAIIGLGLIGGSLGLALKRASKGIEVTGYARRSATAERALRLQAIDHAGDSLGSTVKDANLVILATPTLSIKEILTQISPHLSAGCVVTDVASTKTQVMEWADRSLPSTVSFVGGHPMAGKELSGIEVAESDLFKGCTYCIVPGRKASDSAIQAVLNLVESIGARPLIMTASDHDRSVAGISHLPFVLAAALVTATNRSSYWPTMSQIAATGYRDTTRLASQHPRMMRDICLTNGENIVYWIDEFTRELQRFRELIADGDIGLEQSFDQSRQARNAWIERNDKKS